MFYIGFAKLSEFINALDWNRNIYLAPLSLVKSGNPINICTVSMIASQTLRDHLIYCKIDITAWSEIHGRPFGQTDTERAERAENLQNRMWKFIAERLRAKDPEIELFEGAPSFPPDLMLIPGHIEGIAYDAELQNFVKETELCL